VTQHQEFPAILAFRALPKWRQWALGVPILVGCALALLEKRPPGGPKLAFLETLILLAITILLSELLRPKPNIENARPAGLGDFQFPTATEGRPVPLIWGTVRLKGPNVVWYGDLTQEAITEKVKTGLWSSETITKGFRYHVGVQLTFCRGPDVELLRVWWGEDEAFSGTVTGATRFDIDEPELLGGDEFGTGGVRMTVDFYPGDASQTPNAYLDDASRQRITTAATPTCPAYNGDCYLVLRELTSAAPTASDRGAYVGNSTSVAPVSAELRRFPALFSGQSSGQNKVGSADANPVNVLYEYFTNDEWGRGLPVSDLDVGVGSSFLLASDSMIAESNGFSMALDTQRAGDDLKKELERQMGGLVFQHPRTGKWTIELARDPSDPRWGYNPATVPELTDDNIDVVEEFTRGSWKDTTNQIQVKFDKRADEYKESYALAQDHANAIIGSGGDLLHPSGTPGINAYPGVKLSALASRLAWRDLRLHAYPIARCTFVVNRELWDIALGSVFSWTDPRLGFSKLPMRVTRISYGTLQANKMRISAIQDVFSFAAASMGTPPATGWTPPALTLAAYPTDEQVAFESPRAILVRAPNYAGDDTVSKILCAARNQIGEVAVELRQRNAAGVPGGSFVLAGTLTQFMRIGELSSSLPSASAQPTSSISLDATPDSAVRLEEIFDDTATLQDLGVDLVNLILVGTEFMLVSSASLSLPNVLLANVYRGALDSAQVAHAANDPVYLVFAGAGLTDTNFPQTNQVDVELRMRTARSTYSGSVTFINNTMARRSIRPYPPGSASYNGSGTFFNAPNLEGDGSGLNGVGFDVDWRRRRHDTGDELAELLADFAPTAANAEYRVTVFVDPSGANVQVFQSAWVSGTGPETPTQAYVVNEAAAGTEIRVQIEARHDYGGQTQIESRYDLVHDVTPTSSRTSQFYLGGDLSSGVASNVYAAAATGTFTVNVGAGYSTANVQVQINGGGWSNVIAAGAGTSGTFAASTSDNIELRVDANESPTRNFVELQDPSATPVAYGVFTDGT
jgi:hypothetical protein